jgi:hypothetical protein
VWLALGRWLRKHLRDVRSALPRPMPRSGRHAASLEGRFWDRPDGSLYVRLGRSEVDHEQVWASAIWTGGPAPRTPDLGRQRSDCRPIARCCRHDRDVRYGRSRPALVFDADLRCSLRVGRKSHDPSEIHDDAHPQDTAIKDRPDIRCGPLSPPIGAFLSTFLEVELATMRQTTAHLLGQTTGSALGAVVFGLTHGTERRSPRYPLSHRHRGGTSYSGDGVELTRRQQGWNSRTFRGNDAV